MSKNSPCLTLRALPSTASNYRGTFLQGNFLVWVVQELAGSLLCQALTGLSTGHGFFSPSLKQHLGSCFLGVNSGFTLLAALWW